jgi:hypothetical protein
LRPEVPLAVREEEFENIVGGEPRTLMTPGCYPARLLRYYSKGYSWSEKLVFEWQVFSSFDQKKSDEISSYYNMTRDGGKRLVFGHHSAYRKDWITANGGKLPGDNRRLPLSVFQEKLLLVQVVTVTKDQRGALHPSLYCRKWGG